MHKHSQLHSSPQTHTVSTGKNSTNILILLLFLADQDESQLQYEPHKQLANDT